MSMNRDEPPGLYVHREPLDITNAQQLTGTTVQSSAIHSRTKGWIPTVLLTLTYIPLAGNLDLLGELKLMMRREDIAELIANLEATADAADWDAAYGPREG